MEASLHDQSRILKPPVVSEAVLPAPSVRLLQTPPLRGRPLAASRTVYPLVFGMEAGGLREAVGGRGAAEEVQAVGGAGAGIGGGGLEQEGLNQGGRKVHGFNYF